MTSSQATSLQALFARKGEAAPASSITPLQTERLPVTVRRPVGAGERLRCAADSPLAFLIARRPGGAMPAVEGGMRREADESASSRRIIEVASSAPRRPLTVRLRHEDFLRLRALTEARVATYQSLIEAGILGLLTSADGPPAAPQTAEQTTKLTAASPALPARHNGAATAKRHPFGC